MVTERLLAVQKDRDHMRKRAQETARQQCKSYEEIMVSTLFYHLWWSHYFTDEWVSATLVD